MNCNDVKTGIRVRITKLDSVDGMFIHAKHLTCRRVGVTGTVGNYVGGHGGEVWFIDHDGSDECGAYVYDEFELVETPTLSDSMVVALMKTVVNHDAIRSMGDSDLTTAIIDEVWGQFVMGSRSDVLVDELINRFEAAKGIQRDVDGKVISTS